ncbi:MAG TPA: hypothetical protein VNJ02_12830 [Vicinamibacterales bacterium]|nr:hypothetical protein [Vicinamibacterales bacterium]
MLVEGGYLDSMKRIIEQAASEPPPTPKRTLAQMVGAAVASVARVFGRY